MLVTIAVGFILACIPSAFIAASLAEGQSDKVPIVLIPILIAVFPLLTARSRIARFAAGLSGLALLAFSALGIMSIGLFYFPAAMAMLLAMFRGAHNRLRPEPHAPDTV
jgi:hypothetical protein